MHQRKQDHRAEWRKAEALGLALVVVSVTSLTALLDLTAGPSVAAPARAVARKATTAPAVRHLVVPVATTTPSTVAKAPTPITVPSNATTPATATAPIKSTPKAAVGTTITPTTTTPQATISTTPASPNPTTTTTPKPSVTTAASAITAGTVTSWRIPSNCSANVSSLLSAYLDSLPSGAVFTSPAGACYLVDQGVQITHPLTLIGGTFIDGTTASSPGDDQNFHPIIQIFDTTRVTVFDVTIEGQNVTGTYHPALVEQAGVKVVSSSDVTLDNISVSNTFGDGLELMADLGHRIATPDTNLVVKNYTTNNAGRQGVTLAEVSHATFTNIKVISPADDGFDFESDEAELGSGNIAISDCTFQGGFNVAEPLSGPVTVTGCTGAEWIEFFDHNSDQPVTFSNGTFECQVRAPISCIRQHGGQLTLSHMLLSRHPSKEVMTEPAWSVVNDGHLWLLDTTVIGPTGSAEAGSTVTTTH